MNQKQTFAQQLFTGGVNAFLFWALSLVIIVAFILIQTTQDYVNTGQAKMVFWAAFAIWISNIIATWFNKENKRLRNL